MDDPRIGILTEFQIPPKRGNRNYFNKTPSCKQCNEQHALQSIKANANGQEMGLRKTNKFLLSGLGEQVVKRHIIDYFTNIQE